MTSSAHQSLLPDVRYGLLESWLNEIIEVGFKLTVASADASFRRYFRVTLADKVDGVKTMIVMDAPPQNESLSPFFEIAKDWKNNAVNTPVIYAKDADLGFMLLQDFGDRTFLQEVEQATLAEQKALYQAALYHLLDIQLQESRAELLFELPDYSEELLERECELFRKWYLGTHCQYLLTKREAAYLNTLFEKLIVSAREQRQLAVHRDYHSRNLMILPQHTLGIIDFQDAVTGPLYYDAVSLLKDCYIKLDSSLRHSLFSEYYRVIYEKGLTLESRSSAQRRFDLMGVQRHLKAIGIFCRLCHRDGKNNYLADIPRTASYILELEQDYPELKELCSLLKTTLQANFEK